MLLQTTMSNTFLVITLVFVFFVSVLKYFEDRFCLTCFTRGRQIVSVILGATVVAMFTELLDGIYSGIHNTNNLFVLILPLTFIAFMFLHMHIYKHRDNQIQSSELNFTVKTITSLSDVLIGILAATQIQDSILSEMIFLGILLSYEVIEQLSMHIVHEEGFRRESKKAYSVFFKLFLSALPLIGFAYAYFIGISEAASVIILALYGGTLFSVIVREILSQERKMMPAYFLSGSGVFILLFFINNLLF